MSDSFLCLLCDCEFSLSHDWTHHVMWPTCPKCSAIGRNVVRLPNSHTLAPTPMGFELVVKPVQTPTK